MDPFSLTGPGMTLLGALLVLLGAGARSTSLVLIGALLLLLGGTLWLSYEAIVPGGPGSQPPVPGG